MKQLTISETLKRMSNKNSDENSVSTKAGLPRALYQDIMAFQTSPARGRQPLGRPQRMQLDRNLARQRQLLRTLTEDLELVAEGLAELNPRSPYRPRQQEIHRRLVSRLAEVQEIVTSLQLQAERDDEDKSYILAQQQQKEEIDNYEKRLTCPPDNVVSIKPRSATSKPSTVWQPQPMTSRQAMEERQSLSHVWPSTQDFRSQEVKDEKVKSEHLLHFSPDIIPESPIRLPTPAGSRRSKSRLKRTLSPGVMPSIKAGSSSSSGSEFAARKKLPLKTRKLYKKVNTLIEKEMKPEPKIEKNEHSEQHHQCPAGHDTVDIKPQPQPQLPQQPHQHPEPQQQRPPVRQSSLRGRWVPAIDENWGGLVESRENFHLRSTLGQPIEQEFPLVCDLNCEEFNNIGFCDHCRLHVVGDAPLICDTNCLEFVISGRCPHSYVSVSGFVPYPPFAAQQPEEPTTQAATAEDNLEAEVKQEDTTSQGPNLEE